MGIAEFGGISGCTKETAPGAMGIHSRPLFSPLTLPFLYTRSKTALRSRWFSVYQAMASGFEPTPPGLDEESGLATTANNSEAAPAVPAAGRRHRGLRALLAAAALGSAGFAAVQRASPASSAAGAAWASERRQLSSSWDKEYSREVRV